MRRTTLLMTAILVACSAAWAGPYEEAMELLGQGKLVEALAAFDRELAVRPANTKAYLYAGLTAEKIPDWKRALGYWEKLSRLADQPADQAMAEAHLATCRNKLAGAAIADTPAQPLGESLATVGDQFVQVKTEHFIVNARNRRLAVEGGQAAENHLKRISAAFLRGQMWPKVVSIYVFADHAEYVKERGLPDWSGGGYSVARYSTADQVRRVDLFQLDEDGKFNAELIPRILPHELTHVVMEEWFGQREMPRALNEGLAMYLEEGTHEDYEAICAQLVAKGQYYRLKDLFSMQGYPAQIGVFYVQSASVTRFLIEHMTAQEFNGMMDALKAGQDMNSALSTATGRVGELLDNVETHWVEAMKEKAKQLPKKELPERKTPTRETQQSAGEKAGR